MADEIKQDLGFDAAQALETLNNLNTGFDRLFQTLNQAPQSFQAFNNKAGKTVSALIQIKKRADEAADSLARTSNVSIGGGAAAAGPDRNAGKLQGAQAAQEFDKLFVSANKAGQAVTNTGNAAANSLNKSSRAANGFALSLETVVRVLGTQLIVRALSGMQRAIEASFDSFIKFEQKLATIRSISPEESIASLSQELSGLSNAFNLPLLDVVEAKYQALQNGFQSTADIADVLNASFKFARITNTDAAASVDLVTSALNAYNLEAAAADTLTAKFVKAIELGRISGQELVAAFGRVAPLGKEIGATVDEILAAFGSITIGGVKASEAGTQVNAVMTALIKPTEAMKEAFKLLGVETGEQAVQTFGLIGTVQKLIATTDGSTASIAKLFQNTRAIRGVLREAGSGADVFAAQLADLEKTASATLNRKFEFRIESDAEKVTADFNKFTNFMTTSVGKSLVQFTAQAVSAAGGVDNLIGGVKAAVPVFGVLTAALVAYSLASVAAAARTKLLSAAMLEGKLSAIAFAGGLTTVIALGIAAKNVGEQIGQSFTRSFNASRRRAEAEGQALLQDQKEKRDAQNQLDAAADHKRIQQFNVFIAEQRKQYNEQVDIAREANEKIRTDTKATLDRIIEAHDKFANDLKQAASEADQQVIDSQKRSKDAVLKLQDERFNKQNAKLNVQSQIAADQKRGEAIALHAEQALLRANTDEEVKAAQSAFDRSETFTKAALALTQEHGTKQQIFQLERRQEQLVNRRIQAEERFQRIRAGEAAELRKVAAAEEERVSKLKTLAKTFLDNSNFFDSKGQKLPEDQVNEKIGKANAALAKFKELAFSKDAKFSIGDLVSVDSLQKRMEQSVSQAEIQQLEATPDALKGIRAQIQGELGRAAFVVEIAMAAGVDAKQFEGLSDPEKLARATELLQEQEETVEKMRVSVGKRKGLEDGIAQAQKDASKSFTDKLTAGEKTSKILQGAISASPTKKSGPGSLAEQQEIDKLRKRIQDQIANPNISKGLIDNLTRDLNNFSKTASVRVGIDLGRAQTEFDKLKDVFAKRQQVKDLDKQGVSQKALDKAEGGLKEAERLIEHFKKINAFQKSSADSTAASAQASISWATQTNSLATSSATVAANFQAAAAAMQAMGLGPTVAPTQTPGIQANGQPIAATAPRVATPNALTPPSPDSGLNVNVTQNITSNDPKKIAQDLIPEINRVIRRNAAAIRTA